MSAAAAFVRALQKGGAPGGVYIFYGEEPQLVAELRDALRIAGKYENVERASLELFGDSSRPDSRIASSPGDALFGGGATLYEITAHSPPTGLRATKNENNEGGGTLRILQNIVSRIKAPDSLALSFYGLDRRHHKAKWFLDLGKDATAVVHCGRLDAAQTALWCKKWAREWETPLSEDAVLRLSAQTEGNLSAAKQCLHKMRLAGGGGEEHVAEALSGGARFHIFHLVDAALSGQGRKSLMILNALLDLQEPPPLVLWMISNAAAAVLAAKRGAYPAGLSKSAAEMARAVARNANESAVLEVLRRAALADRVIKGVAEGDIKIALTDAVAALACLRHGKKIPSPPPLY